MRRSRSQVASLAASVKAMYSASVDDSATVDCRFEHQLTGPPFSINMKPEVDFDSLCRRPSRNLNIPLREVLRLPHRLFRDCGILSGIGELF